MGPIAALRSWMASEGLQVTIIPTNDCHFDEYVPERCKIRQFLSGFDGSAGTLVVTAGSAALWTDSRYFLQAERQISGKGIELMKLKMPGTPSIVQWIRSQRRNMPEDCTVGVDGDLFSYADFFEFKKELAPIRLVTFRDPFDTLWPERPAAPASPIVLHKEEYAGRSAADKYRDVVSHLGVDGPFALFVDARDQRRFVAALHDGVDVAAQDVQPDGDGAAGEVKPTVAQHGDHLRDASVLQQHGPAGKDGPGSAPPVGYDRVVQ